MSPCPRLPFTRLALLGVLAVALGLAGCGRKGGLELPPSAAAPQPASASASAANPMNPLSSSAPSSSDAFDSSGRPIAPAGEKKRLPIDWLLD